MKHRPRPQIQISNSRPARLNAALVTAARPPAKRSRPRNLLGVLAFLKRHPGGVALCIGLLLVNIAIEMTLPQVLGNTITGLRNHLASGNEFSLWPFALLYLGLISVRAAVGFILGPIRNRTIQGTLSDLRSAVYNALQRLAFLHHYRKSITPGSNPGVKIDGGDLAGRTGLALKDLGNRPVRPFRRRSTI